jgi:hypothetical protein
MQSDEVGDGEEVKEIKEVKKRKRIWLHDADGD